MPVYPYRLADGSTRCFIVDLGMSADGSVAAELDTWLAEREVDVQERTVPHEVLIGHG
jgi:hypothetical protein